MRFALPGFRSALAQGETIVLPTRLHAAVAVEERNREYLLSGRESWERPKIFSRDAWLEESWHRDRFDIPRAPLLLSPLQERELWRQKIEIDHPALFDLRGMARLAQQADALLAEYRIPVHGDAWKESLDSAGFLRWRKAVHQRLHEENWITHSALRNRYLPPPLQFPARCPSKTVVARSFETLEEEMACAAQAIRRLLEEQQARSIAVFLIDFSTHAGNFFRILNRTLHPSGEAAELVHIHSGLLADTPLISNALLLLELLSPRIHHASAAAIFRSPFVGDAAKERSVRAQASVDLRRAREIDYSLADLIVAARRAPRLQKILNGIEAIVRKTPREIPASAWSSVFSEVLKTVHWPSIQPLSLREEDTVEQWNRALSGLATLSLVAPAMDLRSALSHLNAILNRPAEFGSWGSPVQIFDAGVVEGLEFDHAFVINACEAAWPMPAPLSPLIPYALQRFQNVPASSPEALAKAQRRQTDELLACAVDVRVSFTGSIAPLFRPSVSLRRQEQNDLQENANRNIAVAAPLQLMEDNCAPALTELQKFPGGAGVIKAQSLCPFRAFAQFRLRAQNEDEACFGIDPLARGKFAHTALESAWRRLENQQGLKSLSLDQLEELSKQVVEEAIEVPGDGPVLRLTSEAERQRLTQLVKSWLLIERQRPMEFTVVQTEESVQVELSGLPLKLRADRVDRMNDGSFVLIDYKTGKQTKKTLESDRPEEPQLLLYAATFQGHISGLYFGELRTEGPRAVGHAESVYFPKGASIQIKRDWNDFLAQSKINVHRLAADFVAGKAAVDPKTRNSACKYCKLESLCRVATVAEEEESDE